MGFLTTPVIRSRDMAHEQCRIDHIKGPLLYLSRSSSGVDEIQYVNVNFDSESRVFDLYSNVLLSNQLL